MRCLPASKCGAAGPSRSSQEARHVCGRATRQAGRQAGRKDSDAVLHLGTVVFANRKEGPRELRNRTTQSPFPVHQALLPFISTICLFFSPVSRGLFPSSPTHRAGPAMSCMLVLCALGGWGAQKHTRQRHNQIKSDQPLPSPSSKIRPIEWPLLVLSRQSGKDSLDSA